MQVEKKCLYYDYVVVGGGLAGICSAIAAARLGLKTALINNRSYIGGNAGAEVLVAVNGATGTSEFNFFAREDGIIEEILLENLHRNPEGNRYIWDSVLMDMLYGEENLTLYQNTTVFEAKTENGRIISVSALSSVAETQYEFTADIFTDDTGDGTLGYLAGADYMLGRESRDTFGEEIAPEKADQWVLPSTLGFMGKDTGHPVKYIPPKFAMDISKTKLLSGRVIPPDNFATNQWYYELGGDKDQTGQYQEIMDEHRAFVYGVWDYIKNSGKFPADNYDLEYVASMPGKREWRRLTGDVVLTQRDIVEQTPFEDVIAYGGWSVDLHALEGIYSDDIENRHYVLTGIYRIPFRSCFSRNIENLMIASRCLSASHVAHGSTRLIATLSMIGQAVGTAACLCCREQLSPRQIYEKEMGRLQCLLMKNGHTVLGYAYRDKEDLAQRSEITVSSEKRFGCLEAEGFYPLTDPLALVLPVKWAEKAADLHVICRAEEESELTLRVYLPPNHDSYNPDRLLGKRTVRVAAGETQVCFDLSGVFCGEHYLFFEFEANEKLALGYCKAHLTAQPMHEKCGRAAWQDQEQYGPYAMPGVISLEKKRNTRKTTWDIQKNCCKEYFYRMLPHTICFSMGEVSMYGRENLTNGLIRPYDRPNLWVSEDRIEGEWLEIRPVDPCTAKELIIIFDSGLNRRYVNTRSHDFEVMPELVKDYDVEILTEEGWKTAVKIRGNYQRMNKIQLWDGNVGEMEVKHVMIHAVRILFHAANGVNCVRVYQVSLYG